MLRVVGRGDVDLEKRLDGVGLEVLFASAWHHLCMLRVIAIRSPSSSDAPNEPQ